MTQPALAEAPVAARPPAGRYVADVNHSSLLWRIKHLALAWYTGRFRQFSIDLDFDPDRPENNRVRAVVGLASVRTEYTGSDKDWDQELSESAHFLDSGTAPQATFVSTVVRPTGEHRADVDGELTFRGLSRPVTLHATYNGAMTDHPSGRAMVGFSAVGVIRRSEFGLTFALGPRMPDEVQIIIEAELALAPAAQASQER